MLLKIEASITLITKLDNNITIKEKQSLISLMSIDVKNNLEKQEQKLEDPLCNFKTN